ncbi:MULTISPECIES: M20 metallopeptidase family protein [Brucella/Ochrobactrum group]|uniref:N-acetyl-L,L-diaminopimelate deacetylase n=1 Tax=Ochrobactrum soli TaxID=2448455 RepID=A0A2P9HQ21_9HYPH|nr:MULTISPECIES: M20 family metallopeptidase [Brucella]MCI1002888.1 amidohydrolase [Ochrobactrum sp. C6C9]MDX4076473.1 M20 family metallopeptidase [Brucella sp. NBRC 113783]RRD22247.1 amidohydrolase [Brucellaceae bacterium VT-16-1752]SPL66235.1 N-acetyl-L,L-diaminopimelate deacetylase [[Ochrobactrum] soli]
MTTHTTGHGLNDLSSLIQQLSDKAEPNLIEIRRDIHAHPETGFDVERTAGVVARELERLGIEHQMGVGRTGVVGLIKGGRPGPTLVIRADMDALPIEEQTGLPFASTHQGKMHACGHDLHTATLIGIGSVLKEIAPRLSGNVKLMFQPAEETLESGARAMIADGILDGVDYALGFHNQPEEPTGTFTFVEGVANGSSDEFDITVHAASGHAARPHQAVDPIVATAQLINQLQTVVSREVDPMHTAVLTIGSIHGGNTHNIIPDAVTLMGTVRCQDAATRNVVEAAVRRICAGLEASMRVRCEINYVRGVPSMVSDPYLIETTGAAIREHYGDVYFKRGGSLGSEDFALVAEKVPSFQLGIGASQEGRNDKLHNSDYQPDERSIKNGVVALSLAAIRILS